MTKPANAFEVLGNFEPTICDLYLDVLNLDSVWSEIGQVDRKLTGEEVDQIIRMISTVRSGAIALKKQFYTAIEGGRK